MTIVKIAMRCPIKTMIEYLLYIVCKTIHLHFYHTYFDMVNDVQLTTFLTAL